MKQQNFYFTLLFSSLLLFSFSYVSAQESNIIELTPTDDAYVLADLQDDADELRKFNSGIFDHLKIGYDIDTSDTLSQNISTALLKFDLGDLNKEQVDSAKLQLYADQVQLFAPQSVAVFLVNNSTWSESTLTFENTPSYSDIISVVTIDSVNYYQWELSDVVKQSTDDSLSLMVSFITLLPNTNDVIIFASKDFPSPDHSPKLIIKTSPDNSESNTVKIIPTDDTFIGLDLSTLDDQYDLRNLNSGNLDFIKTWYSNNSTSAQENVFTSGLLKFNLSELNLDDVIDASLHLKTSHVASSGADRTILVHKLNNTNWNESEITFNNRPSFELEDFVSSEITAAYVWHEWNVTSLLNDHTDSEISLGLSYETPSLGHEEQTNFYSKETTFSPYLEITLKESTSDAEGGGCLIATAAYGSELAPQVQVLREIRDNQLLNTESGKSFMESFNTIYYSFSPQIADFERENPILKEAVKIGLTPLLSSLSILNYVDLNSEESILGYGISLIVLNFGMYFVAPVALFWSIKNYIKKN